MMKIFNCFKKISLISLILFSGNGYSQMLSGKVLLEALQEGGYVIVMRHAHSPRELPSIELANNNNLNGERQLDETGKREAVSLGDAFRRLNIIITKVQSSPTYRAVETARLAGFMTIEIHQELSNEGMRTSGNANIKWLLETIASSDQQENSWIITHRPNVSGAFPDVEPALADGEALIFNPTSPTIPVARIKIGEWATL